MHCFEGMNSFRTSTPLKSRDFNINDYVNDLPTDIKFCYQSMCDKFENFIKSQKLDFNVPIIYYKKFLRHLVGNACVRYNIPFTIKDLHVLYHLCITKQCSFPVILVTILKRIVNESLSSKTTGNNDTTPKKTCTLLSVLRMWGTKKDGSEFCDDNHKTHLSKLKRILFQVETSMENRNNQTSNFTEYENNIPNLNPFSCTTNENAVQCNAMSNKMPILCNFSTNSTLLKNYLFNVKEYFEEVPAIHCLQSSNFDGHQLSILKRFSNNENVENHDLAPYETSRLCSELNLQHEKQEDSGFCEDSHSSINSSTFKMKDSFHSDTPDKKNIIHTSSQPSYFIEDKTFCQDFSLFDNCCSPIKPFANNLASASIEQEEESISSMWNTFDFLHHEVDILKELRKKNCDNVISNILSYLSTEELCCFKVVSKTWNKIVVDNKSAKDRIFKYLKEKKEKDTGEFKENHLQEKRENNLTREPLFEISPNEKLSKANVTDSNMPKKFEAFLRISLNEKNVKEKLQKCPRCSFPSTVIESMSQCTRELCNHVFCAKCYCPFLPNHLCKVIKAKGTYESAIIGSKKSKKNLRRL